VADLIYNSFFVDSAAADIDLLVDTIKVMLCTSSYTPTDTHNRRDDVTANEVAATGGYTTGGATLANKTLTQDDTNDLAKWDADDVTWSTSTITARYAILYKSLGGASSADPLIKVVDFGSNQSSVGAAFTIQWHTDGILQFKNGT
jgi:hypothetical protein